MPTDNPSSWRRRLTSLFTRWFRRRQPPAMAAQADDRALVLGLAPSRIPSFRQLPYLPRLLSNTEKTWVRLLVTLACFSLLTIGGQSLARHLTLLPTNGGTLTEGMIGAPQYLNPVLARPFTVDIELNRLLYRGLMRVDDHRGVVPDLAESLTVSEDGKTYTATLPEGLAWSDGQPLSSSDALFTFETIADPTYQSPYLNLFQNVTVAAPDARTVTFTLTEPLEPFRSYLTIGLIPAHVWLDQTAQNFALAESNTKPVSSGPYKFYSITKDRSGNIKAYTFARNKFATGTVPYIDRVIVKFYPEITSAIDALKTNAIDSLGGLSAENTAQVRKYRQLTPFTVAQLTGVFFNQKPNAALKVKEVRQALAMAIDRPTIVRAGLGEYAIPVANPLVSGQPGYSTDAKTLPFDLERAKSTLEQAGWKLGEDGLRKKGSTPLSFTLTTVDDPRYTTLAQQLVTAWLAIGAKVELKLVTADRIQRDVIKSRAYDAFLYGQILDVDGDPYPLWHSSQQTATGIALAVGYDKATDQALDTAHRASDAAKHNAALLTFQNAVAENVPAIILAQNEYLYAHDKKLRGFSTDQLVTPADRFGSIATWYLRTSWRWK